MAMPTKMTDAYMRAAQLCLHIAFPFHCLSCRVLGWQAQHKAPDEAGELRRKAVKHCAGPLTYAYRNDTHRTHRRRWRRRP